MNHLHPTGVGMSTHILPVYMRVFSTSAFVHIYTTNIYIYIYTYIHTYIYIYTTDIHIYTTELAAASVDFFRLPVFHFFPLFSETLNTLC